MLLSHLVLWIVGGLALAGVGGAVVACRVYSDMCTASGDTARHPMGSVGGVIRLFAAEHGTLPQTLEALTAPSAKFGEPYILKIPLDPWGEAFSYRILDAEKRQYELRSAGEDRQPGTADDVVFPDPAQR